MNSCTRLLIRTRTILETRGWIKGSYETEKGCCLAGAAIEAIIQLQCEQTGSNYSPVTNEVLNTLDEILESHGYLDGVTQYNDRPETTFRDILDLIEEAENRLAEN